MSHPLTPSENASKKKGRHWPIMIGIFLFVVASADIAVVVIASNNPGFQLDRGDALGKHAGVESQLEINDRLGWRITPNLSADGREFGFLLTDSSGTPIKKADARIVLYAKTSEGARGSIARELVLTPVAPGIFETQLDPALTGPVEAHFVIDAYELRFTHQSTLELQSR